MKRRRLCMIVTGVLATVAIQANADLTISTLPDVGPAIFFGEGGTPTYGQTIAVPAVDNVLSSWSFWVNDAPLLDPLPVDFAGYVMAWDGSKATGPVLWQSTQRTTTDNGGSGGYEVFTFNTGGLGLISGESYILFISASHYFNGTLDKAAVSCGATPYADGAAFFSENGSDLSRLTTADWTPFLNPNGTVDLAFEASFTSGVTPVPLPGAVLLATLGLASAASWLRRRKA